MLAPLSMMLVGLLLAVVQYGVRAPPGRLGQLLLGGPR